MKDYAGTMKPPSLHTANAIVQRGIRRRAALRALPTAREIAEQEVQTQTGERKAQTAILAGLGGLTVIAFLSLTFLYRQPTYCRFALAP